MWQAETLMPTQTDLTEIKKKNIEKNNGNCGQVDSCQASHKHRLQPSATLSHMTQLIMPQHANSLAITFGGQVSLPCTYTSLFAYFAAQDSRSRA